MSDNRNAKQIESLRRLVDYLEAHPGIPQLSVFIWASVYSKEELRAVARGMGSFEKILSERDYTLRHTIGEIQVDVIIPRETVCKKVVTWECPEDLDSLLAEPAAVETSEVQS